MHPRSDFIEHGYVLLPGAMDAALLARLRQAVAPLRQKQSENPAITRHQTVLEPRYADRAYVDFLNLDVVNETAAAILGTREMSFAALACLLGAPMDKICGWHRDFGDTDPETPALLREVCWGIQTNCAIYDDASLWIVPGSHRGSSLPEESACAARMNANCSFVDATAKFLANEPAGLGAMPGSLHVTLAAGDCLLYNPMLWHAAEYPAGRIRATLHGGYRRPDMVHRFRNSRWGLQDNPFLADPSYLGTLGPWFGPQAARYAALAAQYAAKAS